MKDGPWQRHEVSLIQTQMRTRELHSQILAQQVRRVGMVLQTHASPVSHWQLLLWARSDRKQSLARIRAGSLVHRSVSGRQKLLMMALAEMMWRSMSPRLLVVWRKKRFPVMDLQPRLASKALEIGMQQI